MKSLHRVTVLKLALVLASDSSLVSSYTFDPLNNSWKPSARQKNRRAYQSSQSSSSYSHSPPPPEPAAPTGVEFTYSEEDIVRHHYTAFVGDDLNNSDPAFVSKASLVEIQYNKKTGEVSLLDEEGVVTPEEYKRIVKAVKYENEDTDDDSRSHETMKAQRKDDIAVGTTMYLDPEDLDPDEIIDTDGEDLSGCPPSPRRTIEIPQYEQKLKDFPQQQLQDSQQTSDSVPATVESTSSSFNSYSIPQSVSEVNYSVNHPQSNPVSAYGNNGQQQQYEQYEYSQQAVQTATAVAQPNADQYYYQQDLQQTQYSYDEYGQYYETSVTEQPSGEQEAQETYYDDGTYRRSSGFGFAHRRESFTGTEYEY